MASMPSPKPSICAEKQRLTNAFVLAAREVMELHNREITALLDGKPVDRVDIALKQARTCRDEAKKQLLLHQQQHRC